MNSPAHRVSAMHAWLAFAAGTLFYGYAFAQRVAPSVMTAELMRDFSVGATALGALSAWYFYAYAAIQIPVGLLNDRFGPRKLMSAAVGCCAFASFGLALSESLWAASVFRALIGAAVAFSFVGALTIASHWFAPRRFATLGGLLMSVGMCGAALGQAPLRYAVEQFGWRSTVGALGALGLALAAMLWLAVPRCTPREVKTKKATEVNSNDAWRGLAAVAKNPQSWACAGFGFGSTAILLAFIGLWAVPWLVDVHAYGVPAAAAVASTFFFGWALGSPLAGWLSDKSGRRKPILTLGALGNITLFALVLYGGFLSPALFSTLFFAMGAFGSMMIVTFGSMREVNSPRHSATAMGVLNMCVVGSGAVMQPLVGWLLELGWDGRLEAGVQVYSATNYTQAFSALFAANLLSLTCLYFLRETYCRRMENNK